MNIGTFCSGVGSPEQALKDLGINHSVKFACEIDKYARVTYEANHTTENFYHDLTKLDFNTLPDVDLFIAGFPCFPKGTLITTIDGLKDISDIKKGDMVLTHKKRFKSVVTPMQKIKKGIINLKVMGLPEFKVTEEHPFYVVEKFKKYNCKIRNYEYTYSLPKWVEAKNLTKNHYIAVGESFIKENPLNLTNEQCWLIGRYVADGFIRENKRPDRKNSYNNQVIFGIGKHKLNEFKENIKTYYVGYVEERTSIKCKIINKELMELCKSCGKGAINKKIPGFIMNLPDDLLESFFNGYMSGDGGFHGNTYRAVSISKDLIYQLGQIITRLKKQHYSIIYTKTPDKTIIEGREVNQHDYYSIQYKKELSREYFYTGEDFIYVPVRDIFYDNDFNDFVYNFEVEDDNSYVANNLVVHNCQSFSIAGKRGGFDDTRGTIFFYIHEYLRIKKPKYFILENVKGLLSHDSGNSFDVIIKSLSKSVNGNLMLFPDENSINYHVYYKVLNATDYGIPQNRERVFIVGFRYDNHSFKFPEKQPLKLRLADLLETDINDKYFLSDKALQGLLNHKENQKEKGFGFGANILDKEAKTSPAIRSRYYKDGSECLINDKKLNCINPGQSVANRIYDGDVSMCLSSNGGGGGAKTGLYNIQDNVRRLTPRECARLQGFSDNFILPCSDSQSYKQMGNAICVPVIKFLLTEILK